MDNNEKRQGDRRQNRGKLPVEVCEEIACFGAVSGEPCGANSTEKGPLCRLELGKMRAALREGEINSADVEGIYNRHKIADRRSGEDRREDGV